MSWRTQNKQKTYNIKIYNIRKLKIRSKNILIILIFYQQDRAMNTSKHSRSIHGPINHPSIYENFTLKFLLISTKSIFYVAHSELTFTLIFCRWNSQKMLYDGMLTFVKTWWMLMYACMTCILRYVAYIQNYFQHMLYVSVFFTFNMLSCYM